MSNLPHTTPSTCPCSTLHLREWHLHAGLGVTPALPFSSFPSLFHLIHLQILLINQLTGSQICLVLSTVPHQTPSWQHLFPNSSPSIPSEPPTICSLLRSQSDLCGGQIGCAPALSCPSLSPLRPCCLLSVLCTSQDPSCHRTFAHAFLPPGTHLTLLFASLTPMHSADFNSFPEGASPAPTERKSPKTGSHGTRHLYLGALVTVAILHVSLQLLSIVSTRLTLYQSRGHNHLTNCVCPAPRPLPGTVQVPYKCLLNGGKSSPRPRHLSLTSL